MPVTRFHVLLAEKVEVEVEKTAQELASGAPVDYAKYRELVGYIRGMRACLALCDEIEQSFD